MNVVMEVEKAHMIKKINFFITSKSEIIKYSNFD